MDDFGGAVCVWGAHGHKVSVCEYLWANMLVYGYSIQCDGFIHIDV